jgi:hypothetical protein
MASTVKTVDAISTYRLLSGNGIDCFKWQRPFTKGKFATPSRAIQGYAPYTSKFRRPLHFHLTSTNKSHFVLKGLTSHTSISTSHVCKQMPSLSRKSGSKTLVYLRIVPLLALNAGSVPTILQHIWCSCYCGLGRAVSLSTLLILDILLIPSKQKSEINTDYKNRAK